MYLSALLKDYDYRLSQFSEEIIIKFKQQSEHLLEVVKRAVEIAMKEDEGKAMEKLRVKKIATKWQVISAQCETLGCVALGIH